MSTISREVLPPWGYAAAGATGAVLANAIVYPLDIVKTILQVQVQVQVKPATTATSPLPDPEKLILNGGATNPQIEPEVYHSTLDAPSDPGKLILNGGATNPQIEPEVYHSALDAMRKILDREGISGLYAGMTGSLIGVASTNFAYFYWYTVVRTFYLKRAGTNTLSTAAELSLGAVAGALAQLFTIPVAVITTRQQTATASERKGLFATAQEIINEGGVTSLWRGLKASLVLVINPSITYGAYQKLKTILFPNKDRLTPLEAFLLGALSKSLATLATQPLIVSKVGLQSKPPPGVPPHKSFLDVMRFIVKNEGLPKLFKGIGPQITKGLLVQGLLMMTKERMELFFALLFRLVKKIKAKRLAEKGALALPTFVKR